MTTSNNRRTTTNSRNSGKRGGRHQAKKTSGRKAATMKTLELIEVAGGYAFKFATKAGVPTTTTKFAIKDARDRLIALKSEYRIPGNLYGQTVKAINDAKIDVGVQTMLSSAKDTGDMVKISGVPHVMVQADQMKPGGVITFGDSVFTLSPIEAKDAPTDGDKPKVPAAAIADGGGNGEIDTAATP